MVHVCRYWRGIIAVCPLFWTRIDHSLIPKTFLRRSGSAELDVFLGYNQYQLFTPELVDALIPHLPRVRQLHLDESEWATDRATLYARLTAPAPKLLSLGIISNQLTFIPGSDSTLR